MTEYSAWSDAYEALIVGRSRQHTPHPSEAATSVHAQLSRELVTVEIDFEGVVKYSGIHNANMPPRRILWRSDENA